MEKLLVSKRFSEAESLPENYVFPPGQRPGDLGNIPSCNSVPVIDLTKVATPSRGDVIQQIIQASQEYGFFQVINHGVDEKLIGKTMEVMEEFFALPVEDEAVFSSNVPKQRYRLLTSSPNYLTEKVHFWRDALNHSCHPLDVYVESWPIKPVNYREIVGPFTVAVRKLGLDILDLLCEGMGLEQGYFNGELSQEQMLAVNHYPPCPDPSLALGAPKHSDGYLLTILYQGDASGLQVFKDQEWYGVEPLPNAFVINFGHQLQVISNGKLKSAEHRVITNRTKSRTTLVIFLAPASESVVEPAATFVNESSPPIYRSFIFKDFLANFYAKQGDTDEALRPYRIHQAGN